MNDSDPTATGTNRSPARSVARDGLRRAYARLNLMRNPFGEIPAAERASLVVGDLAQRFEQIGRPGFALQVIGDSGCGKTSCLLAIAARCPQACYVRVPLDGRLCIPSRPRMVIVDEVQVLKRRQRRRLFANTARALVLGTHVDYTDALTAAGFDVCTHRPANEMTVDRLLEICRRRIEWARRGPGPVPRVSRSTVGRLLDLAGTDVRAMEGMLYEAVQRAREPGYVEV